MRELDEILSENDTDETTEIEEQPEAVEAEAAEAEAEPAETVEPEPTAEAEEDPRDKELAGIKAALAETRGQLREMKARQSQPAPEQAPMPDVIDDPQGFSGHVSNAVQAQVYQQKLDTSKFLAVKEYGQEAVDAAFDYFADRPGETQAFADHPSPFHAAVQAHQRVKVATEIGDDPQAYRERIKQEILAEINAQKVAESVTQVGNAPSLATQPNLGTRAAPEWSGPTPLNNLLG